MDCRELGSHARGVYPSQDTSRMETARDSNIPKRKLKADLSFIFKDECCFIISNTSYFNNFLQVKIKDLSEIIFSEKLQAYAKYDGI